MVLVKQLHEKCKMLHIKGYSKLKKKELLEILKSHGVDVQQKKKIHSP
jgi:hypothetical protein